MVNKCMEIFLPLNKMDQDDSMLQDPSLVNPQNKQGYGKDDPDQIFHQQRQATSSKKSEKADKKKAAEDAKPRSMGDQTMQAALQMGVLVIILSSILAFTKEGQLHFVLDEQKKGDNNGDNSTSRSAFSCSSPSYSS